jgi:two-component system sensor histidine kinase KdpD
VLINDYVGLPNISLIFVVPVMVAAARHGLVPSLWVSGLSVLCFNFFFLPPLYQFTIADPANVVALFFFMFVAVARARSGRAPRPDRGGAARGAHHCRALCLQPQDRGRHRPRRPALDRRDPSCAA